MELSDRRVLVTGATGGLGQAISRALHARGAHLVLTGRRADVLSALAEELGAEQIAGELASAQDAERLASAAGDIDVLVANAGLSSSGLLTSLDAADVDRAIDVNLRAPMQLARLLAAGMAERRSGQIIFISSLSGMSGQPGSAAYSATKFGLRGFAQALRAELRPRGVGVSAVLPGFIRDAGMFHEAGAKLPWFIGTSSPDDVVAGVLRAIDKDRAEVVVAPEPIRTMTRFAAAAPMTAAVAARLVGGDRITAKIIDQLVAGRRRDV
ncbi:MAG TPA: SDR family NAD(P)-dependent oxidoreductase [Solirubrobacteraceae bacterium]|nr:SDR family NAD(P)-dependent oxidoreductase [Solirubrobacteraceae bacterium]